MPAERRVDRTPLFAALAAVALTTGGLLVGYSPLSGDPDNLYRPIKFELGRSLGQWSLPFWSDRFGLGAPLAAESHAAAFYPPNWVLFGLLDTMLAYRLEMWLHYLALVLTTYAYARALKIGPWGSALAGMSLALSGFQASHCCHEPFYTELPYLPLALWLAEKYLAEGGVARLAWLALALGAQITLGHFQIQMWTWGLVLLTALCRAATGASTWRRAAALGLAVGWGVAVASAQIGLTYELTRETGFSRPTQYLSNYSFPPRNWAQPIVPKLYMGFPDSALAQYWGHEQTSADEACFYVGTVPLILALLGWFTPRDRPLRFWRWLVPAGIVLAMLPRFSPLAFDMLVKVPGFGTFRAPGRYMLFSTIGLCLLAGRGFERALPAGRIRAGVGLAVVLAVLGFAWGYHWSSDPAVAAELGGNSGLDYLIGSAVAWVASLAALAVWWRKKSPRWVWAPFLVAAVELAVLYHLGTTPWGWEIDFPESSPVMQTLRKEHGVGLVAGELHNLPVRAGLTPAYPYLSIPAPRPNYLLESSKFADQFNSSNLPWYEMSGITHGVFNGPVPFRASTPLYLGPDPALDALLPATTQGKPRPKVWRVERYADAAGPARLALEAQIAEDWYEMYPTISLGFNPNRVWYNKADAPPDPPGPRAKSAEILRWYGRSGEVEHDGTVDLVVRRTYYPGWTYRLDDGPEQPVVPADGGFQAVRIPGSGRTRVRLQYHPVPLRRFGPVSLAATSAALLTIAGAAWSARRARFRLATGTAVE
ncbi:MAG: hypothetical protein U0835_07490 [Isosphaeraceae bacterium]